jgi:hypothetical protein
MNLMCPPWYFELYQQKYARRLTAQEPQAQAPRTNGSGQNGSASAANGFDHDDMGMTAERQRVIQASLFKMLGQADSGPGAAGEPSTNGSGNGASGETVP